MEVAEVTSITDLYPKLRLQGIVKETHMYGAVVDIGLERDGVIHISQLAPTRTNRVTDIVQPGDNVTVWVTKVDTVRGHIGLTMVEPPKLDWRELAEWRILGVTMLQPRPQGAERIRHGQVYHK